MEIGKFKPTFDLKKLPLWGNQVDLKDINFEWPAMADLHVVSPEVKLKTI